MEKIWLQQYPEGVPSEINPHLHASLNDLFQTLVKQYAKRPAFTQFYQTLSYQALDEKSQAFSNYLQSVLQLKKGERVALMMPNLLQYPIGLWGILRAGLTVVNVNPLYTPRELEYQLKDAGCENIVVLSNFLDTVKAVSKAVAFKNIVITEPGDLRWGPLAGVINGWTRLSSLSWVPFSMPNAVSFRKALKVGRTCAFQDPNLQAEDVAFFQYTGGTTGIPKGAMLTHGNMLANLEQTHAWIRPIVEEGKEIIITALPLYHIFSLTANCLTFMKLGALNVLIADPRNIKGLIKILKRHRFTAITGVNTLFKALLSQKALSTVDFKALKISLGGGMSIQSSVALQWKKITGCPLLEAYGLTEACPAICINPLNLQDFNGSIGLPLSSTEVSIRSEDASELPVNQIGELWVRGPQIMKGYWQHPLETEAVLQPGGWLKTGDMAIVDEKGFVWIEDRKKELILVSGFNVYPTEVESIIALMPEVAEVAVVGVDRGAVEIVKAFIVPKDPSLTPEQVLKHCREHLTGYKIPKEIEFRSQLKKSAVGKILKRLLKAEEEGAQQHHDSDPNN